VSDSAAPRTGGWRFFLWWMLAFLGFPLGGLLALFVVGAMEGLVSGALGGALAGAVIGAAQWLVLRRYLRVGPEWVLATALGVAIGDALGALLTGAGTGIGALLITGLATGVAVGLLQWGLALRGRLLRARLWPPVVAIAWPVGWTSRRSPAWRCCSCSAVGPASSTLDGAPEHPTKEEGRNKG
jgi:hypothetical protein